MSSIAFNPIYLPENKGLGNALRVALENATHELVARMDSDDVSYPLRFQKQLAIFSSDESVDIVGGDITEFVGEETDMIGKRTVFPTDEEIKEDMKKRCAMNHVSVMYKKSAVQKSGGYIDWPWNEDYYLWIRMIQHGFRFANVPESIVNVRTGDEMSSRRGGKAYFRSEKDIQKYMYDNGMISLPRYLYNVAIRFGGEMLASNKMRSLLYKLMRKPAVGSISQDNRAMKTSTESDVVYPPFSVATSVYKNDNPEWFDRALQSIIVDQTVKPSEVVLVVDGPISSELNAVIDKYREICGGGITLRVINFDENQGLGKALHIAIEQCSNELIARMDSDDIALPHRFEEQLKFMTVHPQTDIVGGNITEFVDFPDNVVAKRCVPESDKDIKAYLKRRCPFNHMTVMYKKSAVLASGNYKDLFWNEDYYLWIRMVEHGCEMNNTGTALVNVRTGKDMYKRRGGKKYFQSELYLQQYMLNNGIINAPCFALNILKRFIVQVLLPPSIRGWVFKKFARI